MAVDLDKMYTVGITEKGYTIYKRWNKDVGGWDYISDALGDGYVAIYSVVSKEELAIILSDMDKDYSPEDEELAIQMEKLSIETFKKAIADSEK